MKLETGMYVRDIHGQIDKIIGFKGSLIEFEKDLIVGYLDSNDFTRASFDILDLIEKGDYINGVWVNEISNGKPIHEDYNDPFYSFGWENEDIKSIVTKEQFKRAEYKLD